MNEIEVVNLEGLRSIEEIRSLSCEILIEDWIEWISSKLFQMSR